uniref:Putative head-tail joining protein n=1 Tax=viral metagenome TaxID=1070528 RepID=A0A6H1ZJM5_9ZZZZ
MVWGSVKPLAGKRYFEASQLSAEVTGEVRIRYRSDILATMRIVFEGRTLEVVAVKDMQERHRELVIYYREMLD